MRPSAILETVLYATDLDAARRFYCDLLDLPLVAHRPGSFLFLRCGAGMLLIFDPVAAATHHPANPIPRHGATGAGHLCFATRDRAELDRWRAHLTGHGIAIEAEHDWPGGGHSLYIRDPAGNSIEFAETRIWHSPAF